MTDDRGERAQRMVDAIPDDPWQEAVAAVQEIIESAGYADTGRFPADVAEDIICAVVCDLCAPSAT